MTALRSDELFDGADEPHLAVFREADWACVWIKPVGDLVAATAARLTDAISDSLALGPRKVVVIMNQVGAVDPAGLASLDAGREAARARRVKFAVRAQRQARRIVGL